MRDAEGKGARGSEFGVGALVREELRMQRVCSLPRSRRSLRARSLAT